MFFKKRDNLTREWRKKVDIALKVPSHGNDVTYLILQNKSAMKKKRKRIIKSFDCQLKAQNDEGKGEIAKFIYIYIRRGEGTVSCKILR